MTRSDLIFVALGAAISLSTVGGWWRMADQFPRTGAGIFLRAGAGFWVAALTLSAAAVGRTWRFRRPARPGEWVALLGLAWCGATWLGDEPRDASTVVAVSVAVLVGSTALVLARDVMPAWASTIGWTTMAFGAIWGPLDAIGLHGANWFAPAGGFGRGDGMVLRWVACQQVAAVPLGILLAVPVVGAIDRASRRQPATWVERSAEITAAFAGVLACVTYRGEFGTLSWPWVAERGIVAMYLATITVLAVLARRWVARVGPRRVAQVSA